MPSQAALQQTPSAQWRDRQSLFSLQANPSLDPIGSIGPPDGWLPGDGLLDGLLGGDREGSIGPLAAASGPRRSGSAPFGSARFTEALGPQAHRQIAAATRPNLPSKPALTKMTPAAGRAPTLDPQAA